MSDNKKETLPEPPKFNLDDLPEPPKLNDVSEKSSKDGSVQKMNDATDKGVIPQPPGFDSVDAGDEGLQQEGGIPELRDLPRMDPKELLGEMPEPKKEKKSGFLSKLFGKRQPKEEKIDLMPKLDETKVQEPKVEDPNPEEMGSWGDDAFAPPGALGNKPTEPKPISSKEDGLKFPEMPSMDKDPSWVEEGEDFLESEASSDSEISPPKFSGTDVSIPSGEPEWLKEGEEFLEEETIKEVESFNGAYERKEKIPDAIPDNREEEMLAEAEEFEKNTPLQDVKGVGPKREKQLKKAGIKTAEILAITPYKDIAKKISIPESHAKSLVSHAKKIASLKKRINKPKDKKAGITDVIKQLEQEKRSLEMLQKDDSADEEKIIELEGHKDLIEVLQKLDSKRKELVDLENSLNEKEMKLNEHDETYRRDMEHIEKLKRRLDHDMRERTQYLINLEKEYFQKAQDLAKKQSQVEIKEKALEEKESLLRDQETEISSRLNELEDRSLTIEVKEDKLNKLMNDLDKQDQLLKEKEDGLMKKEAEYLRKLDALEDHEKSILKTLEDKRKRLETKEKEIEAREKQVGKKERSVDKKSISMEYAKNILEEEKGKLIDDEFEQYLHDQLGMLKSTSIGMGDINVLQNLDLAKGNLGQSQSIYQLIDTCRDLVRNDRVSEAKVFYNQIREKYYDLDFSQREKESVHNLIRSLYDEINLADIGRNR